MKNILVSKLYKLQQNSSHNDFGWTNFNTAGIYEKYLEMYQYMSGSAALCITDVDEIILHTGNEQNILEVFRNHGKRLYSLWQQGGVNILYVDLDVVFLKPRPWFKILNNHLDHGYRTYGHNCGVRYYGAHMSTEIWDIMFDKFASWDYSEYSYEQDVYSKYMLNHKKAIEGFETPGEKLNVRNYPSKISDYAETIQIVGNDDCLHLHGSSNQGFSDTCIETVRLDNKIQTMKQIFENLKNNGSI